MDSSLFSLEGKTAVVTGAARGLGRAAAVGLAAAGADVAAVDLDAARSDETVREIAALGRRAVAYGCDVSDREAVGRTVAQIHQDFGRIDILVNIAGITARIPTADIPPETVRRLTEVNYYGTFWMCQEVGKIMLAQGRGSIVNMSALGGGLLGMGRGNAAYSATKGAIAALTRDLACEWGQHGIRVNAVAPCWFQTDMNATSIFANQRFMEQVATKLPMRRIGRPHELVGPIVFLAGEASSMITGLVLPVDGGAAATCPIEWKPD
ncbi:MAG: SDR family oxidoreductase [Thermoguttaceae bacterium]|jgi:NAD(P)-dependent dehydrogenase (short-subunit alcohol dehydrogenase family)